MITEDTLTLYFYDDGLTNDERSDVELALRTDSNLAARYDVLCRQLRSWDDTEITAAPAHLRARWHDSIDSAARQEANSTEPVKPRSFQFFSFAWGGALTAALVVGVAIGVFVTDNGTTPPVDGIPVENFQASVIPASFTRGLRSHLQESQGEIAGLPDGSSADAAMLLMQIIEQNRMFERTAQQNNAPNVARVLRAFEPILMRLANDDLAPEDAEALRAQLAFELNVMLTKLAHDPSKEAHTT